MINETPNKEFHRYMRTCFQVITESRVSLLSENERKNWEKRDNELHPSSFPFCALRRAYERMTRDSDPVLYSDFSGNYYMSVGTVIHGLLQTSLGKGGKFIGNWRCLDCKRLHRFCTVVKKCRCGSENIVYREIGGMFGKYVSWHKDGIFQTSDGKLYLVDFKSTYSRAIEQYERSKQGLPHKANIAQIEAYCVMVEDRYEVEISGWMICYLARDYPASKFVVIPHELTKKKKARILESLNSNDRLFGLSLKPDKNVHRLVEHKLCSDRKYYDNEVHTKWNPCPLAKSCFGPKLESKIDAAIKLYRDRGRK